MEMSRSMRRQNRLNRFLKSALEIKERRQLSRQNPWRESGRRHLSHWDNLLEEMKWMAEDFRQETKWKAKQAKIYSRRCVRALEEERTNEQRKDEEEEKTRKKECAKISKEIQKFWWKASKVMQFKIHQRIEAKKRSMLDKHLNFLVSQTERYSTLLAQNLTALEEAPATKKRSIRELIDEMGSDDAEDERQFEEDAEQQLCGSDAQDEVLALNEEAELSLEELMKRYKLSVGEGCVVKHESDVSEEKESLRKPQQKRRRLSDGSSESGSTHASVQTEIPFTLKHTLREYQHVGLDWLVTLHNKHINGILADEMGLGKTIQTIALLAWLAVNQGSWGPHLIVVPTSVMLNWEMEFKKWCPAFKLLTYYGTAKQRKQKRHGWSKANSFHVCITSYALVLQDSPMFRRKKWNYLILDEAHMIKNWKSQRWQTLLKFNSRGRLLLTGTPLQNDVMELWSLMHFLMPHVFSSHAHFKNWFHNPLNEMAADKPPTSSNHQEVVPRLHAVLRPFILRRLKSEVERQLPQKHEHVVYCSMSKRQKKLYEEYMASSETRSTLASRNFMGIINVLMQLRKVCNHPDLFEGRPILSPFDVQRIEFQMPSLLHTLPLPTPLLPYALESKRSRGELAWMMEEVEKLIVPWKSWMEAGMEDEARRCEREQQEASKMIGDGSSSADISQVQAAVEASLHSVQRLRLQHRKDRLQFMHSLNSQRCKEHDFPLLPFFLCSLVSFWFTELSHDWVKSYAHRAHLCWTLIDRFTCYIPKARSKPASEWYSYPDRCMLNRARQLAESQQIEYDRRKGILWTAIARSRLYFPDRRLIQFDCGKLQTLAVLLRKLQFEKHRVLIFTQMSRVLDVLEEFLNIHGYHYLRLDGSTKPDTRQALMQRFNHDPKIFVFILSTRSGGVGVNLTGADTVIFYDSDWNPAMDKQAQDRCHRIGQTREVNIYRLVTRFTIEENILKKSEEKRQLDFLAIQSGEFNLQFLQRLNPTELMDDALDAGVSAEDVKTAMRRAEDETDAEAAKVVEQETAAELAEFNQEETIEEESHEDQEKEEDQKSAEETQQKSVKSEGEDEEESLGDDRMEALLESCSPIERYAIRAVEQMTPAVDVELSATLQLDGLNEDEWELQKLEELKELNEEDIQKEEFRVVDWDTTRAEDIYSHQVEAVQQRLEIERQQFMEAEQRKQSEYLRRLTEQQASLDLATTTAMSHSKKGRTTRRERTQVMWNKLWTTEDVASPWTKEEDLALCFLSEAALEGIVQSAIRSVGEEPLTFPSGVGSAVSLVFHAMRESDDGIHGYRCGEACKVDIPSVVLVLCEGIVWIQERLRLLVSMVDTSALMSLTERCRRLTNLVAKAQEDVEEYLNEVAAMGGVEEILTPEENVGTRPVATLETESIAEAVSVSVAGMAHVTDCIRALAKIPLAPLMQKTKTALMDAAAKSVGQEYFILSLAAQGFGVLQKRLHGGLHEEGVLPSAIVSHPFASSICHGRPWTASARPLQPPISSPQLHPSLLTATTTPTTMPSISRAVMNAPSLLVHQDAVRSYLDPPPTRPRQGEKRRGPTTLRVPLSWATRMVSKEEISSKPMVALGMKNPASTQPKQESEPASAKRKDIG